MIPLNHSKIFLKLEIQVYIKVSCNFTPVGGGGKTLLPSTGATRLQSRINIKWRGRGRGALYFCMQYHCSYR